MLPDTGDPLDAALRRRAGGHDGGGAGARRGVARDRLQPLPEPNDEGRALVAEFVASDKETDVAMESCEFSWTASKLLDAIGVAHSKLNFDALEYAPKNKGNVIRASVQELTETKTFPQIFVNGEFIGGAADACIKWKKGELQPLLEAAGVGDGSWNGYEGDPFEFLPKWMTKNPLRTR